MSSLAGLEVVLIDDHQALRKGVELILRGRGVRIAGTAQTAEQGFEMVRRRRPQAVIVDLGLPGESGAALTRRLLAVQPDLAVLIYTGVDDEQRLVEALSCGARGFALKTGSPEELMTALETVAGGGSYVDPGLNRIIMGRETTERIAVLSQREREVLHLLAQGLTGERIARQLFLSPETVRTHVRNAMEKLDAQTRTHAIVIALRQGEINLQESATA